MSAEEIQSKLHTLIQPYVEDKSLLDSVKPETDLLQDLHINSAHLVDIILDAEDAFGIEIDDDSAEQMLTVGAAVEVIQAAIIAQKSE
ncbi:MAG: acyl carrier protein [Bacteroidota bacterium]